MKNNILILIFIFLFINFFNIEVKALSNDIYILNNNSIQNIPRTFLSFYENSNYNISLNDLVNAEWDNELKTNQSFYNGYWVKLRIMNKSKDTDLGIHHHWNFEKKIIFKNSLGVINFPYLNSQSEEYTYRDDNRIWYNYRVQMPINEITEVYSYFRSKPLDKMNARKNGLDKISIGAWGDIEFREFFRASQYIISTPVYFLFGMYFLLFFLVTKENTYLSISLVLIALFAQGLAFSSSSFFGFRFNYLYGPMGFSAVSAIIINFFRNLLNLSYNYPRIDSLLLWFSRFYILLIFVYFYDSLFYPDSEIYKDLVKYPRSIFGVGTVPIFLSFIPVFIASLISIIISLILWNRGDKSSKYLFITFLIPFVGALIYFFVDALISRTTSIQEPNFRLGIILKSLPAFFSLFMPVTIGLALAQRLNDFKKEVLDKQIELNDKLESTVQQRTLELSNANQLITQSVNSASIIQNAILPEVDCNFYGFNEFEYIWEPRDIVGGDFYWIDKYDDWTSFVVADCTGHGIPGAFMTLISSTLLDRVKSMDDLSQPDLILNQLDKLLENKLKLKENKSLEFGMDIGICSFSSKKKLLRFSGAKMNLYKIVGNNLNEFKGDKISIGYTEKSHPIEFTNHETDLSENTNFYIFSDGITDQVGGSKNLMYGKKRLLKHINHSNTIKNVFENITKDFSDYEKHNKRRDDLSLFGFSIA